MMPCCDNREHKPERARSMRIIGVISGTVLRHQIDSLSARWRIWTIDMNTPSDMDTLSLPSMKRPPQAGALASAGRALRRLRHRMMECCRNRRGYQELAAMSDLELEDLGISRMDIDVIIAGRYDRARPDLIVPDWRDEPQSAGEVTPYKRNGGNDRSRR